ncbi:MAG: complexin-2 [bacterium]|nr:complexin-2 [bacterium]
MASKSVKIDLQTFIKLMRYFTLDDHSNELYEEIKRDIDSKTDKLYRHELYSQAKTADSEQEREQARQKYLDEIGMRDSFRY